MNPERKAEWLAALRSGTYPQDVGQLRTDQGFCCLGVACDLHVKAGLSSWAADDAMGGFEHQLPNRDASPCYPEGDVLAWLGLPSPTFTSALTLIMPNGKARPITSLNDDSGLSFAQIADLIEAQW